MNKKILSLAIILLSGLSTYAVGDVGQGLTDEQVAALLQAEQAEAAAEQGQLTDEQVAALLQAQQQ